MSAATQPLDQQVKTLAISLQRQKTSMEIGGLQRQFWDAYWKLSQAIWSLEETAGISAPSLRDEEDERSYTN